MDTLTDEQSLKLQLTLQRAIPCLLASNDFTGNLASSLRILGKVLDLDYIFISIPEVNSTKQNTDHPDFSTLLAFEKGSSGWQEFIGQQAHPVHFQYKAEVLSTPEKAPNLIGKIADFFESIELDWGVKVEDRVYLIPLWSNGKKKGIIGLGVKAGSEIRLENYRTCLTTYIEILAGWLERCEVFRHLKRERDQLRDLLNIGEPPEVENGAPYPNGEHAINDTQVLNHKIVNTIILFRNLFEENPLGIVIGDAQGNLLRCNPRFAEILGYEAGELNQKTFMNITHPDEIAHEWELVGEAISRKMPLMFMEKRYIHRKGHIVWANVNMSLLYHEDGSLRLAMAMIGDITEKKKISLKLENNEAFQTAILSALPDLKFRISKDGIYLDHYPSPNNDPALQTPSEQFIGKAVGEIWPDYLAKAILTNIKKAIETKQLQAFEYMLPIGSNMYHFEIRLNAIDDDEVVAIVRNVSERNWAQVELNNKIKELDEKNRELKYYIDSNMQLENFAYIASHDLREPLRTMGTFAQLLEKKYADQLDDTAKTYIGFVVQGAKNMNDLIEDLLVYSRIQTQDNRKETIPLPSLLKEVVSGLKESIEEQDARIEFDRIPETVWANPNRLKQLFQNLMANAIKFKKPEVPVEVQVNCRDLGDSLEFEVKDNGIGIDPEFHDRIFLLFKKLHSRKEFQGTGLGLAICKKVVEQMDGEIWIESVPEIGSSFFFTMPKEA